MYNGTQFDELASRYGYIVVYPQVNRPGGCFDVGSKQALIHGGSSDPTSIVSMVQYVQQRYTTDTSRVFVAGTSSGAMMTQVLLATYPDVFAAGAAFAGVPATCFATGANPPGTTSQAPWNSDCSGGRLVRTGAQWGDLARAAYPGYTGKRPRVQLIHGTADTTLSYVNFGEAIKQWTNVLGVSATPASTDYPASGQTRTRYGATGDRAPVEAISYQGVGHNLPTNATAAIHFFGLDSTPTPTPTPTPTYSDGSIDTNASYVLVNRGSSKALDVYGRSTADGGRISQWTRNDGTNQQWQFVATGDGYYKIKSRLSGKVLDVSSSSTADGAAIVQYTDRNQSNQQWRVTSSNGYLTILARHSGKALEVQGASTTDGANVVQYSSWGGANQQWQLVRVG